MIFHYAGKYSGDENDLPRREHPENAVPFREPEDMKKLSLVANIGATVVTLALLAGVGLILHGQHPDRVPLLQMYIGLLASFLTLFPHELLHAICFKKDVYMYTNLKQGLLFVVGPEDMSKGRFIVMSLLPNLVFGFVPYLLFLFLPGCPWLGVFGGMCIGMGFGDYINVFNAACQMPRGARTYLSGMHSYWFMPGAAKSAEEKE